MFVWVSLLEKNLLFMSVTYHKDPKFLNRQAIASSVSALIANPSAYHVHVSLNMLKV